MTAIAQTLDAKLKQWRPTTARKVVRQMAAIIRDAERGNRPRPGRITASRLASDPLFADQARFTASTPSDLAVNHDRYLFDE